MTAELGQRVTVAWGLVAANDVLSQLFADGPTVDKLRDALLTLVALTAAAVAGTMLSAWSTALSGRLEAQVERAVSARCYTAVTGVEVEAPRSRRSSGIWRRGSSTRTRPAAC
ncbi:hypothetical protein [Streptomyces sp. NPDC056549]|uniref:hypothetical protein n=1 Tax=Streptomyces sp. NPDC056549 TaxID=3345864 RepID=UPI0036CF111A